VKQEMMYGRKKRKMVEDPKKQTWGRAKGKGQRQSRKERPIPRIQASHPAMCICVYIYIDRCVEILEICSA
jgi:hypothetical protein